MSADIKNRTWRNVSMAELENIVTAPQGPNHVPLKHAESVTRFDENLIRNGFQIVNRDILIISDDTRCVYIVDIAKADPDMDFNFTVGFINFNDRSRCWTGLMGTRHETPNVAKKIEFLSSHIPESRRRHTISLLNVVDDKIDSTVDTFKKFMIARKIEIDHYKVYDVTEQMLSAFVLAMIREKKDCYMCANDIKRVVELWDALPESTPRTVWELQKIVASVANMALNPIRRIEMLDNAMKIVTTAMGLK